MSDAGTKADLRTIYELLNGFTAHWSDCSKEVDSNKVMGVVLGMRQDFPHVDGLHNASPFKKAANFLCYWVAAKPIHMDPKPMAHPNTYFALSVAIRSLQGAVLDGYKPGDERILNRKIELSKHSLVDVVEALSTVAPASHFKVVTVLLEQMAYKTNPDCQYANVLD